MPVSHTPSLPPHGGSSVPEGSLLLPGLDGRQYDHAGGWFGLARTPSLVGTGRSHPYRRSRGLLCPPPLSSQALLQEAPGMQLTACFSEKDIYNSRQGCRVPFRTATKHRYHLPVLWLGHLLVLVELPQFLIFLSQVLFKEDRGRARHGKWSTEGLTYVGSGAGARPGVGVRGEETRPGHWSRGGPDRGGPFPIIPCSSSLGTSSFSANLTGPCHLLETASGDELRDWLIKRIIQKPYLPPDQGSQNSGD